jgi:YidC/Oxa1 family membrane protein insertase
LLNPLYIAVSWVLLQWHRLFSTFLDERGGLSWALAILFLVVTIRILLFRFFIKQVHSQRKMQEMQPKIAALREKHKNDRQTLSQEMMKLQKEEGFNPLGGCLPILMQAPIFLSLFHVLRLVGTDKAHFLHDEYHWTTQEVDSAGAAKLFGAPIAAAFKTTGDVLARLGGDPTSTKIVTFVLIVLMCGATFITQKQIMTRSGQVLEGQQAMIQKLLLYGMPISLFVSGFLFPLGVLLYWFTNNLWTMGQQFYILHRMPPPGAKKDDKPSIDAKVLAPRPGQKPTNPRARRGPAAADPTAPGAPGGTGGTGAAGAAAASTAADAAADQPPSANANGGPAAAAPKPRQRPAGPKGKRGGAQNPSDQSPGAAPGAADATPPAAPDGKAPDGRASDAAADGATPADSQPGPQPGSPAAGGSTTPAGGPTNVPRPARRPPSRRSSTTTRPKKKRR